MSYLIYDPKTPEEKIYELKLGSNTIGRESTNTIILGYGNLSRYHAEITIADNRVIIKDLQSTNGTFVNNVKIDQSELKEGDLIVCGNAIFKFVESLESFKQDSSAEVNSQKSNVEQSSYEQSHIVMQNLLDHDSKEESILRLPQQDPNQRTVDKLKILLEVSKQLCAPDEPDQLLRKILDLLWEIMNLDRALILMVNEETGELERKTVKSKPGMLADEQFQFYSTKITNLVRNNREAILTSDARIDERFDNSYSILGQSIHASMCVPLKPHNEVIGVLYVDNLSMTAVYSEEDLEFLTALANQAAVIIHMAREFYKREQKLKKQVAQLKIQIDQAKKEQQVDEIVASDFFKRLQQKAKKLRNEE
ncbi:MAG: FHA domain-containing protein [Moorea sp. SIO2B7]|nr:FHA domain-containing protein [Moorena sp. SIO2B7]